jgi:hypothetical protein
MLINIMLRKKTTRRGSRFFKNGFQRKTLKVKVKLKVKLCDSAKVHPASLSIYGLVSSKYA